MNEFYSDYYRMTGKNFNISIQTVKNILFHHNLRFMFIWRLLKKGFGIVKIFYYHYNRKYGLEISPQANIGKGFYIGHPYNITIAEGVTIGKNVNVHKGVTIGRENRGKRLGVPIIGNEVFIGINSTIIGNICIGNDVMIAPNSLVNFDVPNHSIVIGNPATVIEKIDATIGYVNYLVD